MQTETPLYTTDTTKWDRYVEDVNELARRFPERKRATQGNPVHKALMESWSKLTMTSGLEFRLILLPTNEAKKVFMDALTGELGIDRDHFPATYDEWVEKGRPWEGKKWEAPKADVAPQDVGVMFKADSSEWEAFLADLSSLAALAHRRGDTPLQFRDDMLAAGSQLEPVIRVERKADWPNVVMRTEPSSDAKLWFMLLLRRTLCNRPGMALPHTSYDNWVRGGRPWNAVNSPRAA